VPGYTDTKEEPTSHISSKIELPLTLSLGERGCRLLLQRQHPSPAFIPRVGRTAALGRGRRRVRAGREAGPCGDICDRAGGQLSPTPKQPATVLGCTVVGADSRTPRAARGIAGTLAEGEVSGLRSCRDGKATSGRRRVRLDPDVQVHRMPVPAGMSFDVTFSFRQEQSDLRRMVRVGETGWSTGGRPLTPRLGGGDAW